MYSSATHAYVLQNFIIMVFRLTFRFPSAPDSPGLFPDRHPIRLTMCLLQTTPSLLYLLLILIDRRGQHHRGLIDIHRTSTPTLDYAGHLPSAAGSDVPMFRSAGFINAKVNAFETNVSEILHKSFKIITVFNIFYWSSSKIHSGPVFNAVTM